LRIAVTGTHGVGKTTLIEAFVARHPHYGHAQEPYWELVQQGVAFADGATVADLEEQLAASAAMILAAAAEPDVIFDRCPIDFIAYLEVVSAREGFDWTPEGRLLTRVEKAMAALDLLVFVPLQSPDEIAVSIEQPRLRKAVDARLKRLLREDELGLFGEAGPKLVEISGPPRARVDMLSALVEVKGDRSMRRPRGSTVSRRGEIMQTMSAKDMMT
jgi:hypothetical protein